MKHYILIQNDGEIEANSFELIGASTKRGESGKIGFFGSGLKYSIAYMMRNGIEFKVYSGLREIVFSSKDETFRDKTFSRIYINGSPTSYTTSMGATWNEDWFVLREIYCNALDENGAIIVNDTTDLNPVEGKTRIYVAHTHNLQDVIQNWDAYFADERTPLFTCENKVYTSGLGNNDNYTTSQKPIVYSKEKNQYGILYRKGIRCHTSDKMAFDYNLECVNLNEDRTAANSFGLDYMFADMAGQVSNIEWLEKVLTDTDCREFYAIRSTKADQTPSSAWVGLSKKYRLIAFERSGNFTQEQLNSTKPILFVPMLLGERIKDAHPEVIILGMGKSRIRGVNYDTLIPTPKQDYLIKQVVKDLAEMDYHVNYPIAIGKFDDEEVLGLADTDKKEIILSCKLLDMGKREIARVTMEEVEHINSGCSDETRAFQNHIFSSWLKYMEEKNGLFL